MINLDNLFDRTDTIVLPQIDESKDFLSELVGDGKKFKDAKELAKGKAYSDAHIQTLEQTLAQIREELKTRKTAAELIDLINQRRTPETTQTSDNRGQEVETQTNRSEGLSPEDVERMFSEREAKRHREDNLTLASQKLKEIHGEAAAVALQTKAKELGLDTAYLKNMAQEAPNAFLALFSKPVPIQEDVFNAPPNSSFRPQVTNSLAEKWSQFNEVKKTDPNKYWSSGFQRKIMEAAERAAQAGKYEEFMRS